MKNHFILLFLGMLSLLLLMSFMNSKKKSKLKAVTYHSYELTTDSSGAISIKSESKSYKEYDTMGRCIVNIVYRQGTEIDKQVFDYDSAGRLVFRHYYQIDLGKKDTISRTVNHHFYDSPGREAEETILHNNDKVPERNVYTYYAGGDSVLKEQYYNNGKLMILVYGNNLTQLAKTGYKYDKKNKTILQYEVMKMGKCTKHYHGIYGDSDFVLVNKKNQDVESYTYHWPDTFIYITKVGYDKNGRILTAKKYQNNKLIENQVHKYILDRYGYMLTDSTFNLGRFSGLQKNEIEYY